MKLIPELEILEIFMFVLMNVALVTFAIAAIKIKSLIKWLPGFSFFWLTFLFSNIENLFFPDILNFMEHFCGMMAAILIFFAAAISFYQYYTKQSKQIIKK